MNKIICPHCKIRYKAISINGYKYGYCKFCHSNLTLERQKKVRYKYDKTKVRRKKAYIRRITRILFNKNNCNICDSCNNLEFHHENYDYPIKFIVLCKNCHNKKTYLKGGKQ